MKTYLVLLRCGCDDLPLYVTDKADRAKAFADLVDLNDSTIANAEKVFSLNVGDIHCISIVTFLDGKPIESITAKNFMDEDVTA